MKIKFTDWKYVRYDDNYFLGEYDESAIRLDESEWVFESDGVSHHWSVRREEYCTSDEDFFYGYLVCDLNNNKNTLLDVRCTNWDYGTHDDFENMSFSSISEKFNSEIPILEFIEQIEKYLNENIKGEEYEMFPGSYPNLDIFDVECIDDWGKEKLIGFEFEIDFEKEFESEWWWFYILSKDNRR